MFTTLRAFFLVRQDCDLWDVAVFHSLDDVIKAWDDAKAPNVTGVLHVGFERRSARDFEDLAAQFPGRVLLTPAAKWALPRNFRTSSHPIGDVDGEPVFLALGGWGYDLDDPAPHSPEPKRFAVGWIKEFIEQHPEEKDALAEHGILDDSSYIANEEGLSESLRTTLGKFRLQHVLGRSPRDPTKIARAAPPWLLTREMSLIDLTVRLDNVFRKHGIATVEDLGRYQLEELFKFRNFGRTSSKDLSNILLSELEKGPAQDKGKILRALEAGETPVAENLSSKSTLLAEVESSLQSLDERKADILKRRMGWDQPPQTLEEVGQHYGVTRERIRQIESKTVKKIIEKEVWDDLLGAKLKGLLSDRNYPLPLIGAAALDPWFDGLSERPHAANYLLTNLCDAGVSILEISGVEYLTFLKNEDWARATQAARQMLAQAADEKWAKADCKYQVGLLLPEESNEFRSILWEMASRWCHFVEDQGIERLVSFGRGVEQLVEAVLHDAKSPMHYSEITKIVSERSGRDIDERQVRNAAAEVSYLFGPGTFGSIDHLCVERSDWESFADEAAEIISEGGSGRQWHASEIIEALRERGIEVPDPFDKYQIDIALKQRGDLRNLGRMVWVDGSSDSEEARVDIRQAILSIVRDADGPISTSEMRQRLVAVRGINENMQFHVFAPLIKLDAQTWALNDRDMELKRNEQLQFLEKLVQTLLRHGSPLDLVDAASLSPKPLPVRALRCLVNDDDRLCITNGRFVSLAD